MERFLIGNSLLESIGKCVDAIIGKQNYHELALSSGPNCGCGAGGTCASSCVSGCAERGGYGPHK